eukprot:TRINITY_DN10288_c0_g2_i1.p1 TRINITY_DN10288_c0_g2~~TRINITY_DN10288_c0_g2_i1.p1  ORF type:complete len:632 (+),score=110.81 TRINITY_DN10288_c0_g2_i1:219-2114(+)
MTSLLRDSLGGNCKTTMIATMSLEREQISETISTCRFAQRVAMIKNTAFLNEETDPQLIIRRLKKEIYELKQEIALLTGGSDRGPLAESEIERCHRQVREYIEDSSNAAVLPLEDMQKIRQCFIVFKDLVLDMRGKGGSIPAARAPTTKKSQPPESPTPSSEGVRSSTQSTVSIAPEAISAAAQEQIKRLQSQLHQRDVEINILLKMIKKKTGDEDTSTIDIRRAVSEQAANQQMIPSQRDSSSTFINTPSTERAESSGMRAQQPTGNSVALRSSNSSNASNANTQMSPSASFNGALPDKQQAFEEFRKTYTMGGAMEENKNELKKKYADAKNLATVVNECKERINSLKVRMDQKRKDRALLAVTDPRAAEQVDPEEEACKKQIEETKARYQDSFNKLREAKSDIESLQAMLERSRVKMQSDFEQYFAILLRQGDRSGLAPSNPSPQIVSPMAGIQPSTRGFEGTSSMPTTNGIREAWNSSSSSSGNVVPPSLLSTFTPASGSLARGVSPNSAPFQRSPPPGVHGPGATPMNAWASHSSTTPVTTGSPMIPSSQRTPLVSGVGSVGTTQLSTSISGSTTSAASDPNRRGPMLTGNSEADREILAFYQAREKLLRQNRGGAASAAGGVNGDV